MTNKPDFELCFLIYLNRSGSTYLAKLLDEYEEIGVSLEARIPDGIHYKNRVHLTSEQEIEKYIDRLYQDEKFEAWHIDQTVLYKRLQKMPFPITFDKILPVLLQEYYNNSTARIYVYKSPYIYDVEKLRSIFPTAKVLFIMRDLRAIYNSQCRTCGTHGKLMTSDLIKTAFLYNMAMTMAKIYHEKDWFYSIQYEQLLKNPEKEMQKVLQFLQLSDAKNIRTSEYFAKLPNKQKKIHKNINSQPILERINAWQKELTQEKIWLLQQLSKQTLMEQEYTLYPFRKLSMNQKIKILWYWIQFLFTIKGKYSLLKMFLNTRQIKKSNINIQKYEHRLHSTE